MTTRRDVTVKI
jgi:hypothetical protein